MLQDLGEHPGHQAAATAAAHQAAAQGARGLQRPEHDVGCNARRSGRCGVAAQQVQHDPASARMQRRAGGQHGGAFHALAIVAGALAADHRDIAKQAFVAVVGG